MKIRHGFVSNSSSSSFIIAKAYMTEEQIESLRNEISKFKSDRSKYINPQSDYEYENEEVCFYENKDYFIGHDGNNHGEVFFHMINLLKLSKYICEEF